MTHVPTLPFTIHRSENVYTRGTVTSKSETVNGLLRLEGNNLHLQWRLERQTQRLGPEIRTDREVESVRHATIPLAGIAGATVIRRWWKWRTAPRLILTAADLETFEAVAGKDGLHFEHPAELVLELRRTDRVTAEEFAAELMLAVAELAVEIAEQPHRVADESPGPARLSSGSDGTGTS